jgi:hypothetical protein
MEWGPDEDGPGCAQLGQPGGRPRKCGRARRVLILISCRSDSTTNLVRLTELTVGEIAEHDGICRALELLLNFRSSSWGILA